MTNNMKENLVSIITPMYKGAAFVGETIESVLAQDYTNWEMIIVDDCSPDDGAGIREVEKYSKKDNRIRLIKSKVNKGASGARNIALKEANGQFITFLDSDDIWHPTFLREQLDFMKRNNAPIVFCSYKRIDEMTKEEILRPFIVPSVATYNSLLFTDPIFPSTSIYDKRIVGERLYDEKMGSMRDDYVFWLDILKDGFSAYGNKSILVDYRVRKSSVTGDKKKVIKPQWNVYRKHLKFNFIKASFYFCTWAFISFKKYMR